MEHAFYVKNRVVHSSLCCSFFQKLADKKPTLKHIRVFGCAAFVYTEEPRTKFHAKAQPAILIGCNDNGVYMVERISDEIILNSAHVTFDEDSFPGLESSITSSTGESASYSSEPEG